MAKRNTFGAIRKVAQGKPTSSDSQLIWLLENLQNKRLLGELLDNDPLYVQIGSNLLAFFIICDIF